MRAAFCRSMVALSGTRPFVFFTGDLGFMALEPLQAALGPRFINAGVAEQNMVTVAAGVASTGEQCWAYSIAPFIYGRPFEQIRNDVCGHDADVKLVGNGGGYGYGVMGPSHHALEDYGVLLTLRNMRAFVPAFADDVAPAIARMSADPHPAYLRLGRCEKPAGYEPPVYAPWRRLLAGDVGVLVAVGPCVGPVLAALAAFPESERPDLWVATEMPLALAPLPAECRERIIASGTLFVLEEHVPQGSFGQMLIYHLAGTGVLPRRFEHFAAKGYPSGRYGSQAYHRAECGLDAASVVAQVRTFASAA